MWKPDHPRVAPFGGWEVWIAYAKVDWSFGGAVAVTFDNNNKPVGISLIGSAYTSQATVTNNLSNVWPTWDELTSDQTWVQYNGNPNRP
jgi:hypothetical protein